MLMLTVNWYWGPPSLEIGPRAVPRAMFGLVCTNPVQVRSKQPVDLYASS